MSNETYKIISDQTGINDLLHIEKTYYECNGDEVSTILKLMNMSLPKTRNTKKLKTLFDDLREICDEKDTIFQEFLSKNRNK